MRPSESVCRCCLLWKRKTQDRGQCWRDPWTFPLSPLTQESDTCLGFRQKVTMLDEMERPA
jgi:hypothetical protein